MKEKQLLIGCSGGNGHIAAITGYYENYRKSHSEIVLPMHQPVVRQQQGLDRLINLASHLSNGVLRPLLKGLGKKLPIPKLPPVNELNAEIHRLEEKNQQPRCYVDMLLDVCPQGFESVAIWNCLQKKDATGELNNLIKLQFINDLLKHSVVKDYFFRKLTDAVDAKTPYTRVVTTQPVALAGLCDAVIKYNNWAKDRDDCEQLGIDLFMTEMPTTRAVDFFKPLAKLNKRQAKVMKVHAVNLDRAIINKTLANNESFDEFVVIEPRKNPMVRPGFIAAENDKSREFSENCLIEILDEAREKRIIKIAPQQPVASIMLSSQASFATIIYAKALVEQGYLVFVFGGGRLQSEFAALDITEEQHQSIILLANQDAPQITQIKSRSQTVVDKSGGLTALEELAMPHSEGQLILIHCANNERYHFTSGIKWEDGNADELIEQLASNQVIVEKSMPCLAAASIAHYQAIKKIQQAADCEAIKQDYRSLLEFANAHRTELNNLFVNLESWLIDIDMAIHCLPRDGINENIKFINALFYYGISQFSFIRLVSYLQEKDKRCLLNELTSYLLTTPEDMSLLFSTVEYRGGNYKQVCNALQLMIAQVPWKTGLLGTGFFGGHPIRLSVEQSQVVKARVPKHVIPIFDCIDLAHEKDNNQPNLEKKQLIWKNVFDEVIQYLISIQSNNDEQPQDEEAISLESSSSSLGL